jgi:enoyl-CoA hydratase/carnithine racemase
MDAVSRCHEDGTRMLVIEGSGPNFCTGFDLSDLKSETDDSLLARFVRVELLLQAIHYAPFLTIALARGRAFGAGADLFAACEQRWIVDSATFSFPGAAFGLVLGTARLARRVGSDRAREWIRTGETISPESALEAGLASRIIGACDMEAGLASLASGAQRLDPVTQAAIYAASLGGVGADRAADLYQLTLSAARAGIKERIETYRMATKSRK